MRRIQELRKASVEVLESRMLLSGDDAYEPNDTFETASSLGNLDGTMQLDHLVNANDDWYSFTMGSTGTANDFVKVSFTNASGDLDLSLYDSTGNLKKFHNSTTDNEENVSLSGFPGGLYYIKVYFDSEYYGHAGGNPDYSLTIHTPTTQDDGYEPNNTPAAAWDLGTLQAATTLSSLSCLNDDYFKFTTTATGNSSNYVSINFLNAAGNLDLDLYNSSGTRILRSNSFLNGESISLNGLAAGTYLARVYGYNGATNTNYTLTVNAPFSSLQADSYEPNNAQATAADLGQLTGAGTITGLTIGTSSDIDWYKFTTPGSATQSDYARILFSNSSGDLDMELRDSSDNLLAKSNGRSNTENISLSGMAAGTYYLKIFGYNGAINNYTLAYHGPAPDLAADAHESNDTFDTATDLRTLSGAFSAENMTIHSSTDADVFKFTTGAAGTADNSAFIVFDQSAGDLDLVLYDSNQTQIGIADTTNATETISMALPAGTYYLKVYGYHSAENSYTLTINAPIVGAVEPDDYESSEPLRLSQDQTATGLTIHDPAQNDNEGDRADSFVFTTTRKGVSTDYVQIDFSTEDANLKLTLENSSHQVLTTASAGSGSRRISLSGYAAGTYYVVVDLANPRTDTQNPGYSLTINAAFSGESSLPLWTILAYVDGDNNLEDAAIADVNEMEAAATNPNVQIGVMLDRIPGNDSTNGNWSNTRRGVITHDSKTSVISSTLTSVGEKDMSSVSTLQDFISWGVSALPAQNYMLVIWDHGAAIEGAAFDDSSNNDVGLSLTAINQALASSPQHISIMGFDACLMATAEMLSAVSNTTDYLVASEQTEGNDGWNYTNFINSITSSTDAKTLASNLVQQAQSNDALSTMSAVETGDDLDASIADFVSAVLNNGTTAIYNQLESARRATASYDYEYMHDLGGFMTHVIEGVGNSTITAAAQDVLAALGDALVNNYSTSSEDGTGLTIYLPSKGESLISSYGNLSFSQNTGWKNFLKAFRSGTTTAPASVGSRDWAESNDYLAAATNLNLLTAHDNVYSDLSINTASDVDWFRFAIGLDGSAADQASIAFNNSAGNLDLYLYNSEGNLLSSSTSASSGTETISLNGLAVDEYYLKIAGASGSTNPDYSLTIDAPDTGSGDWAEDNDTRQKATALTVGKFNGGLTLDASDIDWYTFQADRLPSINPIVVTSLFDSSAGTLQMQLINALGNTVAESTLAGGGATLTYSTFTEGAYWLKVTGTPTGNTLSYSLSAAHDFSETLDSDSTAPTATLNISNITKTGGKTLRFTVAYTDPSGVNASSLGTGDIQVRCGTKYAQTAMLLSTTASGNTITAKYRITAPGGSWNIADRGTYSVTLLKKQVKDSAGNWNPAALNLGSFKVFPASISSAAKSPAAPIDKAEVFSDVPISRATAELFTQYEKILSTLYSQLFSSSR